MPTFRDLRSAFRSMGAMPRTTEVRVANELRTALAPVIGPRMLNERWMEILPNHGLTTRFDDLVPWLGRECSLGRGPKGSRWGDVPLEITAVLEWWEATGRPSLDEVSWAQAVELGQAWHRAILAGLQYRAPVPRAVGIVAWPDGARIARLTTGIEMDAEGISMGHCLRRVLHYSDDVYRGDIVLVSYRCPRGIPQCTIEIDLQGAAPHVVQLQGPHNGEIPDPDARDRLAWWLVREIGLTVPGQPDGQEGPWPTRRQGGRDHGELSPPWAIRLGLLPSFSRIGMGLGTIPSVLGPLDPLAAASADAQWGSHDAWSAVLHDGYDKGLAWRDAKGWTQAFVDALVEETGVQFAELRRENAAVPRATWRIETRSEHFELTLLSSPTGYEWLGTTPGNPRRGLPWPHSDPLAALIAAGFRGTRESAFNPPEIDVEAVLGRGGASATVIVPRDGVLLPHSMFTNRYQQ